MQPIEWDQIFANNVSDKRLICKIYINPLSEVEVSNFWNSSCNTNIIIKISVFLNHHYLFFPSPPTHLPSGNPSILWG